MTNSFSNNPHLFIIGAGAAGMISAIAAKTQNPCCQVTILEKNQRVGKKLLATGNGRCNIGNSGACYQKYFNHLGNWAEIAKPALERFSAQSNRDFFGSLGLLLKEEEEGKLYPYTNQATSVLDLLRLKLADLKIELLTDFEVGRIEVIPQGFRLLPASQENHTPVIGNKVILACGGIASPQLSSSQGFSKLVAPLGHSTTKVYPALVQIKTENSLTKALKGVKIFATAKLYTGQALAATEEGEVLFTEYGLSGPPIFQLSALVSRNAQLSPPPPQALVLDLMPEYQEPQVLRLLIALQANTTGTLEHFLVGMLNKRLGQQVLKRAGLTPLSLSIGSLTPKQLGSLAKQIKALPFQVLGTTGWQNAQVMAGGLEAKEFNPQTLESKKVAGFYAAGEVLDVYGSCGGYNLNWAWSSGRLAGEAAAKAFTSQK